MNIAVVSSSQLHACLRSSPRAVGTNTSLPRSPPTPRRCLAEYSIPSMILLHTAPYESQHTQSRACVDCPSQEAQSLVARRATRTNPSPAAPPRSRPERFGRVQCLCCVRFTASRVTDGADDGSGLTLRLSGSGLARAGPLPLLYSIIIAHLYPFTTLLLGPGPHPSPPPPPNNTVPR